MPVREQRQDPPALDAVTVVPVVTGLSALCAAYLLLVGRGVAVWLAGEGWVWPSDSSGVWAGVGLILSGRPLENLGPASAAGVPPTWVVYLVIALVEAAGLALAGGATYW